jgi:hypothetical protein
MIVSPGGDLGVSSPQHLLHDVGRRKDLPTYERSKIMVRLVETAAEVLREEAPKVSTHHE